MATMAPMQQYQAAMAENRMRDQMGQQMGGADPAAMMAEMMAAKTVAGKGRKRKGKK